jgi:methyltransferase family protein
MPDPIIGVPVTTASPDLMTHLDGVDGWFSPDQVDRVATRAAGVRAGGRIVEIGSFRGRSTIAIARSAPDGVEIVAIDPHAGNDRGPQEIEGFEEEAAQDHEIFLANLTKAEVAERVRYIRKFSHEAHAEVGAPIDVLHIDGAHRFAPARDDIRTWGAKVAPGGTLLIHDSFSSVGVTLAIMASLLLSGRWRYVGRSRSLAEYRREPVRGRERLGNVGRQLAQLPWFARNLAIKALVVAGLEPLAHRLGLPPGARWPY